MHAVDLLELGAWMAVRGAELARRPEPLPQASLEQFWAASKCRQQRWIRQLKEQASVASAGFSEVQVTRVTVPLLHEVLASELLTRSFAAMAAAYDKHHGAGELLPIGQSLLTGHLEARNRVLRILAGGTAVSIQQTASLNNLRRKLERWTDMLLAHLGAEVDVAPFAFEPERAAEFTADLHIDRSPATIALTCQLALASIRGSVGRLLAAQSPSRDLNIKLAVTLTDCFEPQIDELEQLIPSLWLARIEQRADATELQIQELLAAESRVY